MKKIKIYTISVSLLFVFSISIIIILKQKITSLLEVQVTNTKLRNELEERELSYNFEAVRAVIVPHNGTTLKRGNTFVSDITLGALQSKSNKPIIIIADSIDEKGILIEPVDTFQTELWNGTISKTYNTVGEKVIYGKYLCEVNKKDTMYLDFSINITVY